MHRTQETKQRFIPHPSWAFHPQHCGSDCQLAVGMRQIQRNQRAAEEVTLSQLCILKRHFRIKYLLTSEPNYFPCLCHSEASQAGGSKWFSTSHQFKACLLI